MGSFTSYAITCTLIMILRGVFIFQISLVLGSDLFLFDHTFRKLENDIKKRQADSNSEKLLKRIGVAMGEEDLDSDINVDSQIFMKRTGELADDFSKRIPYNDFKLTPDDKSNSDDEEALTLKKETFKKLFSNFNKMTVGKIDRMSEDEEDIDVSIIPMEHRTKHGLMSPMTRTMEKARQLLVSATNIVLSPETVSTYLAQMWITNIMQTVGWGLIAAFTAKTAGRSFSSSKVSRRKMSKDSHYEQQIDDEEDDYYDNNDESMGSLDSKAVATILRGLADAADNWGHNEL